MFCGKCGTENLDEDKFCVVCGRLLGLSLESEPARATALSVSLVSVVSDTMKATSIPKEQQNARTVSGDELGRFMINQFLIALGGVISVIKENLTADASRTLATHVRNLALDALAKNTKLGIGEWCATFEYMLSETQKIFNSDMDLEKKTAEIGLLLSSASCLDRENFEPGFVLAWGNTAVETWRRARIESERVLDSQEELVLGNGVVEEKGEETQVYETVQLRDFSATIARPLEASIEKVEIPNDTKALLKTTLNAARDCFLECVLESPAEFRLKKQFTQQEIDFWLRKVSLALLSFSYYLFFPPAVAGTDASITEAYEKYWGATFVSYNIAFKEQITMKDIDYYASGHKEIEQKGYGALGRTDKITEMVALDHGFLGAELLERIWGERINFKRKRSQISALNPKARKTFFVAGRVRKATTRVTAHIQEMLDNR